MSVGDFQKWFDDLEAAMGGGTSYSDGEIPVSPKALLVAWNDDGTIRFASELYPFPVDAGQSVMSAASDVLGPDTLFDSSITNTVESLKSSPGAIYGWDIANNHTTDAVWIQFFNVAAGSVVLGTTVPKFSLKLPGDSVRELPSKLIGTPFSTAISYACTSSATGSGAPSAAATATFWFK